MLASFRDRVYVPLLQQVQRSRRIFNLDANNSAKESIVEKTIRRQCGRQVVAFD